MSYAYELENGGVAHCNKLQSVPEGAVYVEVTTLPDAPRSSWRIVNGVLTFDTKVAASIVAEAALVVAKEARDSGLDLLVHDFGDGRKMQVRPKDEQYVKGAIDLMEMAGVTSMDGWVMEDNKKYTVTVDELKAARLTGLMGVQSAFAAYKPQG
tara:strand:- start:10101 stop:10562 length:462 start_codon:yes stop_codon:yes gene_type:complete